ncbi:MAG: hypothetical protein J5933_02365, partial [Clostridia bacterium]|nr:hypothetical protein [Clostridia bacterium]
AELGGRLFMTTGSLSLSTNRFLYTFYYNKKLAEDYSNSYPDLSNLYSIVFDGKWTFDLLSSLAGEIYEDLDGDSARGDDDLYGFGCHSDVISDGMWSGFDVRMLGRDEDGWLTPEVNEEKLYKAFDMLSNFMHNTKGVSCYNDYETSDYEVRFAAGTLLFFEGKLNSAESAALRNMQD